jgi:hypothetical protein
MCRYADLLKCAGTLIRNIDGYADLQKFAGTLIRNIDGYADLQNVQVR